MAQPVDGRLLTGLQFRKKQPNREQWPANTTPFAEPGRLPIRLRDLPGELCSSFVARLVRRTGIRPGKLFLQLGHRRVCPLSALDTLPLPYLAPALAARTMAAASAIERMRFTAGPPSTGRDVYLVGRGHGRIGWPIPGWLQFCPVCLRNDDTPYFRRSWRLVTSTCCIVHECVLVDRCPYCLQPIRESDLALVCCGHSLASAPHVRASPLGLLVQYQINAVLSDPSVVPGSADEDALLRRLAHAIERSIDDPYASRPTDLFPIERHALASRLLRCAELGGASRDPIIEAHNAWLDAVGRPLIEQIRTARSATRRRCADRKRRSAESPQHGTCDLLAAHASSRKSRRRRRASEIAAPMTAPITQRAVARLLYWNELFQALDQANTGPGAPIPQVPIDEFDPGEVRRSLIS